MNDANPPPVTVAYPASSARSPRSARPLTFGRHVTGLDVVLAFLAIVLAPAITAVILIVASVSLGQDSLIGVSVPLAAFVACGATWATLIRRGWSWPDLGFVRASRSLWHLLWEVPLLWIAAILLTVVVGTQVGLEPSRTDSSISSETDALHLGVVALLITAGCLTLLIPALEEILFRRVLFGWIEQRVGVTLAIVGSALMFGLVHIAPPVVLLQFFIGLGAAVLVSGHRTLWASLALHGLNNGIVTVAVLTAVR